MEEAAGACWRSRMRATLFAAPQVDACAAYANPRVVASVERFDLSYNAPNWVTVSVGC